MNYDNYFISGTDADHYDCHSWCGFLPFIVATLTGAILGNVVFGLKVGALIELAFAGLTPAGGTQPPNPVFAGLMGVVLAYTAGCSPEQALGLCLPFSFFMGNGSFS